MGALNAQTGRVDTLDNSIVGRKQVIQFLGRLNAAYPQASRISVVLDNWSIHQPPSVQEALQALPRLDLVWGLRMPHGSTRLRSSGAGCGKTRSTCMLSLLQFASRVQPKCLSMSACSETAC